MASVVITSFFTLAGSPRTGLTPSIRIWEVDGADQTLVIGAPEGTGDPGSGVGTDGTMIEMFDKSVGVPGSGGLPIGGSQDGFYKFEFTDTMGYDETKTYVIRADAGLGPNNERYQVARLDPTQDVTAIANAVADQVWDEPRVDHLNVGSTGEALNQTNANAAQLLLDVVDLTDLVTLLLKYETNRTRVDPTAKTLTVYDDDCTTPLRTFNLKDASGNASATDVCERTPAATGTSDGLATCDP